MSRKIVTMGEIMLRLSTPEHRRFVQSQSFDVCYGGGEANVAVSLSNYGYDAEFVSAVPQNEIGDSAVNALRTYGVGTEHIARCGERLGIYYLESGSAMRPSKVIYDRAGSSIATAGKEEFDFDAIMKDADWFHFTGITPAVSDSAAELVKAALVAAKANNVKVSCDLNFRKKLWTSQKAQSVMRPLMEYVDVCIGNEEDAAKVLGYEIENNDVVSGKLNTEGYKGMFEKMADELGFEVCVSSLRVSHSASDNGWSGCVYNAKNKEFFCSREYRITPIVDRIGGGDSFAAGMICGLLDGKDPKDALSFAVAASALKHTIPGDFNLFSRAEVEALMEGDGSGRVQR
ncbi:MAG: sugar kinase [Lachnospiraceae bacterium]|nr:sugar kinase [Lachnospiraceae bacterium]